MLTISHLGHSDQSNWLSITELHGGGGVDHLSIFKMYVQEVSLWWVAVGRPGTAESWQGLGKMLHVRTRLVSPTVLLCGAKCYSEMSQESGCSPSATSMLGSPCPEKPPGMDSAFLVIGNDSVVWECPQPAVREQSLLSAQLWPLSGGLRRCSPVVHHFWLFIRDVGGFIYLVLQTQLVFGLEQQPRNASTFPYRGTEGLMSLPFCYPVDKLSSVELSPSLHCRNHLSSLAKTDIESEIWAFFQIIPGWRLWSCVLCSSCRSFVGWQSDSALTSINQ